MSAVSGVRYVGYLSENTGYGQAARDHSQVLAESGVAVGVRSILISDGKTVLVPPDPDQYPEAARLATQAPPYDTVIVHSPPYGFEQGREQGRRNIGVVAWETDSLPASWRAPVQAMDEIWVPSEFCRAPFQAVTSAPVCVIPHPVAVPAPLARDFPGVPEGVFLFVAIFEWQDRKNPEGLVRAFLRAFAGRRDVALLLKVGLRVGGKPGTVLRSLHQWLAPRPWRSPPIYVLEGSETSSRVIAQLHARADAYVSLHRAEGFGLCMAEAMARGKPVVATGYSGNLTFMDSESAFLVDYDLVPIVQRLSSVQFFERGMRWAEPRTEHAVEQLRACVERASLREQIAKRGLARLVEVLAPRRVGELMRARVARPQSAAAKSELVQPYSSG